MAEQVQAVGEVLDAIGRRRWDRLGELLHPEIHWTNACEEHLHGVAAVVEAFTTDPPPAPPSYHEQVEGQMIRWIDCPG